MCPTTTDNIVAYAKGPVGPAGPISQVDIDALKDGVPAGGDTLKKLYDLIAEKAPIDSAELTNAETTTQAPGNDSNLLATTAFVQAEVANSAAASAADVDAKLTGYALAADIPPVHSVLTNALAADVALNNTANYFDGPSVAQGAVGTWLVVGSVTLRDVNGAATFGVKLWDGATVIASCTLSTPAINTSCPATLTGVITAPVGNLRISVRDFTSTGGEIKANGSGSGKDSVITAVRLS